MPYTLKQDRELSQERKRFEAYEKGRGAYQTFVRHSFGFHNQGCQGEYVEEATEERWQLWLLVHQREDLKEDQKAC